MAKRFLLFVLLSLPVFFAGAQTGYLKPPKDIEDMVRAKPTPSVNFDSKGEWMLLLGRESYGSVEELAKPELRIAGLRIDPANLLYPDKTYYRSTLKNNQIRRRILHTRFTISIKSYFLFLEWQQH